MGIRNALPVVVDPTTTVGVDWLSPAFELDVRPINHPEYRSVSRALLTKDRAMKKQSELAQFVGAGAKKAPKSMYMTPSEILGEERLRDRRQVPALAVLVEDHRGIVDDETGKPVEWGVEVARDLFGLEGLVRAQLVEDVMSPYKDTELETARQYVDADTGSIAYNRMPAGVLLERLVTAAANELAVGEAVAHEEDADRLRPTSDGSTITTATPTKTSNARGATSSPKSDG